MQCLEILEGLSPIKLNVIAMEGGEFIFNDWKSVGDFRRMLAEPDLPTVGDVFITSLELGLPATADP
jgi:hypothetical protein